MFQYYNAHPKNKEVGDCVKRALCIAADLPYMEVQRELNRIKRELGEPDYTKRPVSNEFIRRRGWECILDFGDDYYQLDGNQFAEQYPTGTYVLRMHKKDGRTRSGHMTVMRDGTFYDTWDPSDCGIMCVWKVEGIAL